MAKGQGTKKGAESGDRVVLVNRRAYHDYEILETFEAGIVLVGTEVKSVRAGRVNLQDAYCKVENGEVWLYNMHISPYSHGNRYNPDPVRPRKLLLHKWEINRLMGKAEMKGLTIVPLKIYFRRGYAKVEIAIVRGKKLYDKREAIAERDRQREEERMMMNRQ
ncbi:MAG: SsrA-binding protein [Armatimonadota bacterium]|nr:MAG: SsrA-binding protein [Armatimonadota bacterium]